MGMRVYALGKFLIAIELHAKSSFERRCAPIFGVQAASVESSTTVADDTGLPFDTDLDAPPDVAAAQIDATVALPLESRPRQTEQPSLARVPARSDSPIKHDDAGLANCDLASHNLSRDWRAAPAAILKSDPPLAGVRPGRRACYRGRVSGGGRVRRADDGGRPAPGGRGR